MDSQTARSEGVRGHVCRIDGIIATDANKAVIFRRGPSKHVQLLTWDLYTDEIVAGQWLNGKVVAKCSDVSPDGRYLIIAASKHSGNHLFARGHHLPPGSYAYTNWTAISRPPYFTALAIWFSAPYDGGGYWKGSRHVCINPSPTWYESTQPPSSIKVENIHLQAGHDLLFKVRLLARGWRVAREEVNVWEKPYFDQINGRKAPDWAALASTNLTGVFEKPFAKGCLRLETAYTWERWSVVDLGGVTRRSWAPKSFYPQWLDVDASERIVFADEGCLWAWKDFPDGEPVMISDLNPNKFQPVTTPDWAKQW